MKRHLFVIAILLLAGCSKPKRITFTGKAPGMRSGVFIIKNQRDSTIIGVNIKDGQFTVSQPFIDAGFYTMDITSDDDKGDIHSPYEVYLDTGSYNIEVKRDSLSRYPKIISSSSLQNELSAYNTLPELMSRTIKQTGGELAGYLAMKSHAISSQQINYIRDLFTDRSDKQKAAMTIPYVLDYFVYKYPNNHIAAREMLKLNYEQDPQVYYDIFKKFSPALKNSAEGRELGNKLSHLIGLVPGAITPEITGKTPDGKSFAITSLHKKVILVDFWRSVSQMARNNHEIMMTNMLPDITDKDDFGIVSISIDDKAGWWTDAIKQDKMTWTQVSDLKGNDSPNAVNWGVSTIPTYCLVDGDGRMIIYNIAFETVAATVNTYLKKH